jgi:hypothetical protein
MEKIPFEEWVQALLALVHADYLAHDPTAKLPTIEEIGGEKAWREFYYDNDFTPEAAWLEDCSCSGECGENCSCHES